MNDPAEIADARRPQDNRFVAPRLLAQQFFYDRHRPYQTLAIIWRQAADQALHCFGTAAIERPECGLAFLRQSDIDLAAVIGRAFTRNVIRFREFLDNPA